MKFKKHLTAGDRAMQLDNKGIAWKSGPWDAGLNCSPHPARGPYPWQRINKIWRLDELIKVIASDVCAILRELKNFEGLLSETGKSVGVSTQVSSKEQIVEILACYKEALEKIEMEATIERISQIEERLKGGESCSYEVMQAEIKGLHDTIYFELRKHCFVYIKLDNITYLEQEKIFGDSVYDAFPSIRGEIKDAANCLAVELFTASVFHAMRAAEKVLRILARDRRVKIKKTPIDYAGWKTIIDEIAKKVDQQAKAASRSPQKAEMLEFYRGAIGSFMGFKDAFRDHVSHSRDSYDSLQAHSVFLHVWSFMDRLSSRLKEDRIRPIAWRL
jgi:hypothetical protein